VKISSLSFLCPPLNDFLISGRTPFENGSVFGGKVKTLTVDNGSEFSRFKELEDKTGLTVYFADPYAAWQRGTNENTNGLLR